MKTRTNIYLYKDRLNALKLIAEEENTNVSDLVREAIDLILAQRLEQPRRKEDSLDQKIRKFIETYASSESIASDEDIDEL